MRVGLIGLMGLSLGCGNLQEAATGGDGDGDGDTTSTTSVTGTDPSSAPVSTSNGEDASASGGSDPDSTSGPSGGSSEDGGSTSAVDGGSTSTTAGDDATSTTGDGGESDGTTGAMAGTPETCAELGAAQPGLPDGEYTLHVAGDQGQPWAAYCVDLDGSAQAYLPLPAGPANNYATYADDGPGVVTEYTRVAIDEVALEIDIDDMTFSASAGSLMHGGDLVTEMSYGVAMSCTNNLNADARVDLTGTPFSVTTGWCTAGSSASGQGVPSDGGQVVDITGEGFCGWTAPSLAMACPYNPYNGGTGATISLQYTP